MRNKKFNTMKKFKFLVLILLALPMSIGMMSCSDDDEPAIKYPNRDFDFTTDGLYYAIISAEDKTVGVAKFDNRYIEDLDDDEALVIPSEVVIDNETYTVTSINDLAFSDCNSLKLIEIPGTITSIGIGAFAYCDSLESVIIPNSVASIGIETFYECQMLKSVVLGNSVPEITKSMFLDCKSLESVTIGNAISGIDFSEFSTCKSLVNIEVYADNQSYASYDGVLYDKNISTLLYLPAGRKVVNIPASYTEVDFTLFNNHAVLDEINVSEGHSTYSSYKGAVYNKETSELLYCPEKKEFIDIPESFTAIKEAVFEKCAKLDSVFFETPNSSAWELILDNCSKVKKITFNNAITSIDFSVLHKYSNLEDAEIYQWYLYNNKYSSLDGFIYSRDSNSNYTKLLFCPAGKKSITLVLWDTRDQNIDESAFSNCTKINRIKCYGDPVEFSHDIFEPQIFEQAALSVPTGKKEAYANTYPWNKFKNISEL